MKNTTVCDFEYYAHTKALSIDATMLPVLTMTTPRSFTTGQNSNRVQGSGRLCEIRLYGSCCWFVELGPDASAL